jgi:hypothetical protein
MFNSIVRTTSRIHRANVIQRAAARLAHTRIMTSRSRSRSLSAVSGHHGSNVSRNIHNHSNSIMRPYSLSQLTHTIQSIRTIGSPVCRSVGARLGLQAKILSTFQPARRTFAAAAAAAAGKKKTPTLMESISPQGVFTKWDLIWLGVLAAVVALYLSMYNNSIEPYKDHPMIQHALDVLHEHPELELLVKARLAEKQTKATKVAEEAKLFTKDELREIVEAYNITAGSLVMGENAEAENRVKIYIPLEGTNRVSMFAEGRPGAAGFECVPGTGLKCESVGVDFIDANKRFVWTPSSGKFESSEIPKEAVHPTITDFAVPLVYGIVCAAAIRIMLRRFLPKDVADRVLKSVVNNARLRAAVGGDVNITSRQVVKQNANVVNIVTHIKSAKVTGRLTVEGVNQQGKWKLIGTLRRDGSNRSERIRLDE